MLQKLGRSEPAHWGWGASLESVLVSEDGRNAFEIARFGGLVTFLTEHSVQAVLHRMWLGAPLVYFVVGKGFDLALCLAVLCILDAHQAPPTPVTAR